MSGRVHRAAGPLALAATALAVAGALIAPNFAPAARTHAVMPPTGPIMARVPGTPLVAMAGDPFEMSAMPADLSRLSTAEKAGARQLLRVVRRSARRRFPTLSAMRAAGYRFSDPATHGQTSFRHLTNRAYVRDGRVLDPARPESLMVLHDRQGWRLVGVMFRARLARTPPRTPAGGLVHWHVHVGCGRTPSAIPAPRDFAGLCPPGQTPRLGATMMFHVWLADSIAWAFVVGPPAAISGGGGMPVRG
jgi:hypothetical protein